MSSELSVSGIPAMTPGEAVGLLSKIYASRISGAAAVMLWGAPGIGKSDLVRQVCDNLERDTGKRVVLTDLRLSYCTQSDLLGLPVKEEGKNRATWLVPKPFDMDFAEDVVNVLFLDELTAALPSIQVLAYSIVLDRCCGVHKLPDNCIVLAAGNRTTDASVSYKMSRALANRFIHLEIVADASSWREWALNAGVSEKIVGFLGFRPDYLSVDDPRSCGEAYPSPRSWAMASGVLADFEGDVDAAYPLIAGAVGLGVSTEFREWCRVFSDLPPIPDVFRGRVARGALRGMGPASLHAIVGAISAHAKRNPADIEGIGYALEFGQGLPMDFQVVLVKDLMSIENVKDSLPLIPQFASLASACGRLL